MQDKTSEKRLGMQLMNNLQRIDGSRGKWSGAGGYGWIVTESSAHGCSGSQSDKLHKAALRNYEDKQKELMAENEGLRAALASLQKDLVAVVGMVCNNPSSDLDTSGIYLSESKTSKAT